MPSPSAIRGRLTSVTLSLARLDLLQVLEVEVHLLCGHRERPPLLLPELPNPETESASAMDEALRRAVALR
jgi:hypothetical protein